MQQTITIEGKVFHYMLRRRRGTRRVSISLHPEHGVILSLPWYVSVVAGEQFLRSKAEWVEKKIAWFIKHPVNTLTIPKTDVSRLKRQALQLVHARLAFFNQHYKFMYKKISIRQQKTRWGSCSKSGTISFNLKLALVDPALVDYVVVHELCHVKEMNHSAKFWTLVAETIPDYKERRKKLKSIH